ncbi:hypothetical protein EIMP300_86860 [Escherichia coli]|uniref:Uncharacterized protein n=1 Tax=Escherichia coli TaxID=562 RepID=A0A8S0G3F2_ECOLX|nr:hypothetical protein EIMP300_86860 [Escherichia coli]
MLILDEPTASLDTQEVELLFGLMRQLRDRGVSLIFVTHFLDQVYQVSDRITVLRNGSFVGCRETRELPQIELVKMMLGRELDTHALQRAGRTLLSDKPVAAFKNYGKKGTIAPFDLEVRPGEIVGLAGLLGSGRTETAEVIFGIKPADSGTALIKGKPQTLFEEAIATSGFSTGHRILPGRQENRWHHRCRLGAGKYHPRSPGPARLATTHFPQRAARDCRTLYPPAWHSHTFN